MINFDHYIDRNGTDCKKYDPDITENDVLPMWIADTDFSCPEEVLQAAFDRAAHPCFGYPRELPEFSSSLKQWLMRRHRWDIDEESIVFVTGVIPAAIMFINEFSEPGDGIVVNTPLYPPLQEAVLDNERQLLTSSLEYSNSTYNVNFVELENLLSHPKTKIFILCNPHNPIGKMYTETELRKIGQLCLKYDVMVFSDEIHSDIIVSKNKKHIPFASLSEEISAITCTSFNPGKAFNVAGVRTAAAIMTDDKMRQRFIHSRKKMKGMGRTVFGQNIFIACYQHGDKYVSELNDKIRDNFDMMRAFVQDKLPELALTDLEATYLVWINFEKLNASHSEIKDALLNEGKLYLNDGLSFGEEGLNHMRMNIAVPKDTLQDGLKRLEKAVNSLKDKQVRK